MRYMGLGSSEPTAQVARIIDDCEAALLNAIRPVYTYSVFDIVQTDEGISVEGTSLLLTGNAVRLHLQGCNKAVLLAATLGIGADKAIKRCQVSDMTGALATDALASAAIEQVCNIAEEEIREAVAPLNMTWRFSPGYGDLPLDLQRSFLMVLNAQKRIGLTVTDSLIMLPSKSVTALIGLSENTIEKRRQGCAICNMRQTCQFRKRGERCVSY
jgi:5-methyltetrahydrofolate--homocysteine methyltransferase